MRSFISASKTTAVAYTKVLACICAMLIVGLELGADYLLKHKSVTYERISRQYDQALGARPAATGEPASVLMVGNSLLLHGVKMEELRALTSSNMHIYPIFLEATGYYDWLYGLRRIFRQGARPNVVVVGVGVNYFLENGTRQDYEPMVLLDARDTFTLASDLHLDHTATSNLLLSHSSRFWDTRSAIRTQVLEHVVPHLQNLFSLINSRPSVPEEPQFDAIATPRLQRLRELCEENGAKLILLVPPTLSSEDAVIQMVRAAHNAGVDVSVPIDPDALSAEFYQVDGLHLNSQGAAIFTSALAKDLPERVISHNVFSPQPLHAESRPISASFH